MPIDQVQLNFNPASLQALNVVLAVVMFGVALDLKVSDFRRVVRKPFAPAIGLLSQFLLMPAFASLILWLWQPAASIALGILLVAACPGGTVSNFFSALARGNAALSVSMSAVSTLFSIVMTPLNFTFWGRINPSTAAILNDIALSPLAILFTVLTILVLPTGLGMALARWRPAWAARLLRPMRVLSVLVMVAFIALALIANWPHFLAHVGTAFWIVLIVNATALALGYSLARLVGLPAADRRAITFETGIQNSGFGLILIFNFFGGLGGMALIAAWWGVWHLVTGLSLALIWSRRPPLPLDATQPA